MEGKDHAFHCGDVMVAGAEIGEVRAMILGIWHPWKNHLRPRINDLRFSKTENLVAPDADSMIANRITPEICNPRS